jgi:membrane protease YdiL (CAAX protease family)
VAPWWHTVVVMVWLAAMSVVSHYQHGLPNAHVPGMSRQLSSYVTVTAAEWSLVVLIWLALHQRGLRLGSLIGGRWDSPKSLFKDVGLAVAYLAIVGVPISWLGDRLGPSSKQTDVNLIPTTPLDLIGWVVVSVTAGFCEEYFFRGYLTAQFAAWTRSRWFAIIAQAIFFGLCHAYYGVTNMGAVTLLGFALGLLAYWRKSLRPGMLAHGLVDSIGGIVAFFWGT